MTTGVGARLGAVAAVVVLGGLWSFSPSVGGDRLGEESSGLLLPCLLAGAVLGAGTGFLCHRLADGTGLRLSAIVAAAMLLPWAATAYGFAKWINAVDVEDREQPIDCTLLSKRNEHASRGGDLGWVYRYRCTVEGTVELHGTYREYANAPSIDAETGEPIRMQVARGRLGIWLRRSDPITPPPR